MPKEEYKNDHDNLYPSKGRDGDPNCPLCQGRGCVTKILPNGVPGVFRCKCILIRDILINVDRGWANLSKAPKIESSPLQDCGASSLYVTAERPDFRAHVRWLAVRMGPDWFFKVISDVDLMTAWLGNIALRGDEIYDSDVARDLERINRYRLLMDLVEPPELLIVITGVKVARNIAMSEVLAETILQREHLSRPTWVVDQPNNAIKEGHLCYSPTIREILSQWKHIQLDKQFDESFDSTVSTIGGLAPSSKSDLNNYPGKKNKEVTAKREKGGAKK